MKLLITGGHVTPALACIDLIQKQKLPIEITFVGRKFAQSIDTKTTFEYKEITNRNIPFHHLDAGRLTRSFSLQTFKHILNIPVGLWNAYNLLKKIKPDTILSFGGYLAVPIAVMGKLLNISVYTHEQTIEPGLANKMIANVAKKVFVSFPETAQSFPAEKVIVTGNPIRETVFQISQKPFEIVKKKPVIYITGGSLGAHSINVHIEKILPKLLKKYTVIHQCGNTAEYNDLGRLQKYKNALPANLSEDYHLYAHILAEHIGYVYSVADIVISRAGANTFFELSALKKPTIFIPLPISANGEQQKHAEIFAEYGVGEIFEQQHSHEELLERVDKMVEKLSYYKDNFKKFPQVYVQKAAQSIIDAIYKS